MFEITLQAFAIEALADTDNNAGIIVADVGFQLPAGPGQMANIAIGRVRFPVGRQTLLDLAKESTDAANLLKPESNIAVASNLAGVEEAIKADKALKGK